MDKPVIRPMTEDDVRAFFGQGLERHARGWAVDYKGEVACIAGVTIYPTLMLAWSQIKPGVRAPKRLVLRTALQIMDKMKGLGYPVIYAMASPDLVGARKFLTVLGWEYIESSARGDIFKWQIR